MLPSWLFAGTSVLTASIRAAKPSVVVFPFFDDCLAGLVLFRLVKLADSLYYYQSIKLLSMKSLRSSGKNSYLITLMESGLMMGSLSSWPAYKVR